MRFPPLWPLCLAAFAVAETTGFSLKPSEGALQVEFAGKPVAALLTANDTSTPARANETYKPYLRICDPETGAAITKGPGGTYTHHRGIFIGWMRVALEQARLDLWSMGSGRQIHTAFKEQVATANEARLVSLVDWKDKSGRLILSEQRTHTLTKPAAPAFLQVDFTSVLTAEAGDLVLEADPEHGGVHYRAPQETTAAATQYFFPTAQPLPHKDVDYPWVGMTYLLSGKTYGVVEIDHPANPRGTRWSAYRDYARFGAYPKASLKKGEQLTLRYRFLISAGELTSLEAIQRSAADFTGKPAVPAVLTMKPAEVTAAKVKK